MPRPCPTAPSCKGYFETIAIRSLAEGEVLKQHCFEASSGHYYDEHYRQLPAPSEPCGVQGLHSYRTIDDDISDALAIPRAAD
jgi:hypothetical protein